MKRIIQNIFHYFFVKGGTIILFAFIIYSCEEPIDVDLTNIEQRIVIDGIITDAGGRSRINIGYSQNAYTLSNTERPTGVKVKISDDLGNSEVLVESSPGIYIPNIIKGEPGRTYYLEVEHNGKTYSASSKMNPPLELDSIKFKKTTNSILGIPIAVYYVMNCYIANKSKSDEYGLVLTNEGSQANSKTFAAYNGKYLNGAEAVIGNSDIKFYSKSLVNIELFSLDEPAYNYFSGMISFVKKDDLDIPDIFKMTSYNPRTNFSNKALGYFSARSYKKYTAIVQ